MYLPAVIPTHTLHHFSLCILVIINICHNICAYIHTNCVVFLRLYLPNSYIAGQVLPTSQLLGCQNGPSVFRIEFVFGCMSQLPVNLVGIGVGWNHIVQCIVAELTCTWWAVKDWESAVYITHLVSGLQ